MHIVAHIDMDAFFAAIEERDRPWLKGSPVVVGADPEGGYGRGVVATANYKAREYGIRSAMPIQTAYNRSKQAQAQGGKPAFFLTPQGNKYTEVSQRIINILKTFGPVEQASVDEAYVDLSHLRSYKQARCAGEHIKKKIKKEQRLTASIGIGPNKLVAKIATEHQKPDGLTVILPSRVISFLHPLPIQTLPGVGPHALKKFKAKGVHTVGDAANLPFSTFEQTFGARGADLYDKVWGKGSDDIKTIPEDRLSIGEQETYASDTLAPDVVFKTVREIAERIERRAQKKGIFAFRHVRIQVRFSDFQTYSRSHILPTYQCSAEDIFREAIRLILPFLDGRENKSCKPIRLVGVRIEQLI